MATAPVSLRNPFPTPLSPSQRSVLLLPTRPVSLLLPRRPVNLLGSSPSTARARAPLAAKSVGSPPSVDVESLVRFLERDLPHLFDEQGIDRSMYDDRVRFLDPINKYDSIDGYLFNIWLLKALFSPTFTLHHASQTGPLEITTRWTMEMQFALLPWKPTLVFTGVSIMGINPQTGKFSSHVDLWDSIQNNDYFSVEGLLEVVKQVVIPRLDLLREFWCYETERMSRFLQEEP